MNERPTPETKALRLIQEYLEMGGAFNPELMEHDKVRDMVMIARDELAEAHERNAAMREAIREAYYSIKNASTVLGTTPRQDIALTKLQPYLK